MGRTKLRNTQKRVTRRGPRDNVNNQSQYVMSQSSKGMNYTSVYSSKVCLEGDPRSEFIVFSRLGQRRAPSDATRSDDMIENCIATGARQRG